MSYLSGVLVNQVLPLGREGKYQGLTEKIGSLVSQHIGKSEIRV